MLMGLARDGICESNCGFLELECGECFIYFEHHSDHCVSQTFNNNANIEKVYKLGKI